ncbi:zinc ABC transporter substrate-binding protein [Gynuella sp.]|uniref:zinc ABC transporter substrate-binding protein n=1 Tax=Gynuella sp. TaxID=2969146 RepID=UPI003D146530
MRKFLIASLALLMFPLPVLAAAPKVAVDIAPLHSLVSQVMDGVEAPSLLIQSGASPHQYSMRPSEAEALSEADIVFWVSEGLTPWLEKSLDTIAGSALKIEMLELEGTTQYDYREGATFEAHDHHDHEDHEEHGHHHEGHDPHAWLDPVNAKVWVKKIASVLSEKDPMNASVYQQNAAKTLAKLDELIASIKQQAEPLKGIHFIVFHDAYQYFEKRFGLSAAGAISLGDASDPSPARIAEIRDKAAQLGVTCVFTEPQFNAELVHSVFENTSVHTIGVMDPLGADIDTGVDHYGHLLNSMITSLSSCKQ